MQNLIQYLYNPLCICCGSFFVREHLFCDFCFDYKIKNRSDLKIRNIKINNKVYNHYYLFDWIPAESDVLSNLVYALKGRKGPLAYQFYSKLIVDQLGGCKEFYFDEKSLVIPIPGSKKDSVHSNYMAQKISNETGLLNIDLLYKNFQRSAQKSKNLENRSKTQFYVKNDCQSLEQITRLQEQNIDLIFVDDVLTTGNSFKLAKELLAAENRACIITLFFRLKSDQTQLVVSDSI